MAPVYCALELDENENVVFVEHNGVQFQKEWSRLFVTRKLTYAIVKGTEDIPKDSNEYISLGLALQRYATEADFKFIRVKATENPDIRVEFRKATEDHRFIDNSRILAYAFMPGQGSLSGLIVFNEDYLWSMNGKPVNGKMTFNLNHVMPHELGHTLGLLHDEHNDTSDMLDPIYNPEVLELSDWDIVRFRNLYPIRVFKKWSHYARLKKWLKIAVRRF